MDLSKRLSAIAAFVTNGNRLADVGCDHGYIPITLIEEGRIPSAIAMDVRRGPLDRAKEHILSHDLQNYIEVRLSDGVQKLNCNEADTVLIAGMGGQLIRKILSEGKEVLSSVSELVLQPQSDLFLVRQYLCENHYCILDEQAVLEDGKYYFIFKVTHGEEMHVSESDLYYGYFLRKRKDPLLRSFLEKEMKQQKTIMKRTKGIDEKRFLEVEAELIRIQNNLEMMI